MLLKDLLTTSPLSRPETEILLASLVKKNREFILAHPEEKVALTIKKKFEILAKKRLKNWPLAYLTGRQGFYNLDLSVSPQVLIPRPETELLVEELLAAIENNPGQQTIIDIGTGSGAIILATVQELLASGYPQKNLKFIALDISPAALAVAKKNAARYGLRKMISFHQGDLLEPIQNKLGGQTLLISANLPYLTPRQIKASPSIQREPRLALDGGADGLKYYRRLFRQLARINYSSTTLLLEIDPSQAKKISTLAKTTFKQPALQIILDRRGRKRIIKLTLRPD